jgi:hypothetical protein
MLRLVTLFANNEVTMYYNQIEATAIRTQHSHESQFLDMKKGHSELIALPIPRYG